MGDNLDKKVKNEYGLCINLNVGIKNRKKERYHGITYSDIYRFTFELGSYLLLKSDKRREENKRNRNL